ncbi:MAG: ABC transporter permease [Pseudomonadota bacterium]
MASSMTRSVISDFTRAARLWRLAIDSAWLDWRRRYSRSALGVAWVFFMFAAFVGVKIVVFGNLSPYELNFFAHWLTIGFLLWQFISASMTEGCTVFTGNERWIKANVYPFVSFVFQAVCRHTIQLLVSGVFLALLVVFVPVAEPLALLWFIPGLAIYLITAVWVQLLLGVIAARFGDIAHLVQTLVRLLFFLTPILWVPGQFGRFGEIAYYNPLTHYLAIIRDPIVGNGVPLTSWFVVAVITVLGVALSLAVFAACRRRIVFWV